VICLTCTGKGILACTAAISFPLPEEEIKQAREQSAPWVSIKLERSGEGVKKKGEGVGLTLPPPPVPYFLLSFAVLFLLRTFLEKAAMQAKEIYLPST